MSKLLLYLCIISIPNVLISQNEIVNGHIISKETSKPIINVNVQIENSDLLSKSNNKGLFILEKIPLGEQVIVLTHNEYTTKRIPIIINQNNNLHLGNIELTDNFKLSQQSFATIDISENNNQENEEQFLLQANRDPFLQSVAFNWSSTFFKVRGLGSEYSKILINGVEMNKSYNYRPNWSNWSGLNDILKSQETSNYTTSNSHSFGHLNGVTLFQMHANAFAKSNKISLSSTNRSYQGRLMATHHSGMLPNNWSYSLSFSIRKAQQGYVEGTNLNAKSFFGSVERKINTKHNLSLGFIYTPVERGKSSPNTSEVTNLKGSRYNSYWGSYNGKIRNSRIKKVKEPIITLSHFWKHSGKLFIQNNLLYQKGSISNSRLDYTGTTAVTVNNQTFYEGVGTNPDPAYYQNLPSYFLRTQGQEDYEAIFLADKEFRNNGEINWEALYQANNNNENATYLLYEDRNDDRFFAINSIFNHTVSDKLKVEGKLSFKNLKSHNYAQIIDLFGSSGYLDIDAFSSGNEAQNNLQTPNRIVSEGDNFKYNYILDSNNLNGFLQTEYQHKKYLLNFALFAETKSYQRKGIYENGHYPETQSLGKSERVDKFGFGSKLNITYQINPKAALSSNLFYKQNTPSLQNFLINPRQSNLINPNFQNEINTALDLNFNYQYNGIRTRLSTYLINRKNSTKNSFFFSEDISGLGRVENADFFQQLITGMDTQNIGFEFGSEIKLLSTLSLQLSVAYGIHKYINNPNLQITSDSSSEPIFSGQTNLNNYRLANGPQQAYGIGFNYRDPTYWWFASQLNFFTDSFINISPFIRTANFATDIDGLPFTNFDETRARELLRQEEFPSYFLWNAIGGKSWRLKKKYVGITIGIQNILDQIYKTGGFEQSRNSNFQSLNEDQSRTYPLFDSKYWHGNGTTFYINTYLRF